MGEAKLAEKVISGQNQYVAFRIAEESFGIDVMNAHEVLNMSEITHIPNTLKFMKGVTDLRGKVLPLIDMRSKFNIEEKVYNDQNVIIVVELLGNLVGLIVDAVLDVLTLNTGDIQKTLHFTINAETDAVTGIVKCNEDLIVLLDVEKIFTDEEFKGITKRIN
jgi:purine-binding chemotaxis protein CheW